MAQAPETPWTAPIDYSLGMGYHSAAAPSSDGKTPRKHFSHNRTALAKGLGLGDTDDLDNWLGSKLLKPWWDKYKAECLDPIRKKKAETNQTGGTGSNFITVRKFLRHGEMYGIAKYSDWDVDTSEFGPYDHGAYFLYHTVEVNKRRREGVFYGKNMTDDDAYFAMWQVRNYLTHRTKKQESRKPEKANP